MSKDARPKLQFGQRCCRRDLGGPFIKICAVTLHRGSVTVTGSQLPATVCLPLPLTGVAWRNFDRKSELSVCLAASFESDESVTAKTRMGRCATLWHVCEKGEVIFSATNEAAEYAGNAPCGRTRSHTPRIAR